jgi:hypothetical protein
MKNFILVQNNIRKTYKKLPIKENSILVQTNIEKNEKFYISSK